GDNLIGLALLHFDFHLRVELASALLVDAEMVGAAEIDIAHFEQGGLETIREILSESLVFGLGPIQTTEEAHITIFLRPDFKLTLAVFFQFVGGNEESTVEIGFPIVDTDARDFSMGGMLNKEHHTILEPKVIGLTGAVRIARRGDVGH